jgi:hypothetical protein
VKTPERKNSQVSKGLGIVNNAKRYAIETVFDAASALGLFQRIITISLKAMKIVRSLPKLGDLT